MAKNNTKQHEKTYQHLTNEARNHGRIANKKPVATSNDFRTRCESYAKSDLELLKKFGLRKRIVINFRNRNGRVPFFARVAASVLGRYGAVLDYELRDALTEN